jgi:hypothetical protein
MVYRRGQVKTFPWFFGYLIFIILKTPVLLLIQKLDPRDAYFYSYWTGEALSVIISLLVIYEIYNNVLTSGTLKISSSTFFSMIVALFVLSVILAKLMDSSTVEQNIFMRAVLVLSSAARLIQVGLLAILLFLSAFFGLYLQSQAFGIVLGYGLYAITDMTASSLRSILGPAAHERFAFAKVCSYLVALGIWFVYAYKSSKLPVLNELPQTEMDGFLVPLERFTK